MGWVLPGWGTEAQHGRGQTGWPANLMDGRTEGQQTVRSGFQLPACPRVAVRIPWHLGNLCFNKLPGGLGFSGSQTHTLRNPRGKHPGSPPPHSKWEAGRGSFLSIYSAGPTHGRSTRVCTFVLRSGFNWGEIPVM